MQDDLVRIYIAETLADAQLVASRLEAEGIKTFIDNSDNPLDGLTAAEITKDVCVLPSDQEKALEVLKGFEEETSEDFEFEGNQQDGDDDAADEGK